MLNYWLQRPEVLSHARRWNRDCFPYIYDHSGPDGDAWAVYYGYVELITFYCSAVLYAQSCGLINKDVYTSQHEPLIRLLLAEHYPIFSMIICSEGYVSRYIVEHVSQLGDSEWDWKAAHLDLVE